MTRFLQGITAIETRNARLNMSSKEVEGKATGGTTNKSYVKKIKSNEGIFPYASPQNMKYCIKIIVRDTYGHKNSNIELDGEADKQTVIIEANPYINYDEDVMGFMRAKTIEINKKDYDLLSKEKQSLYEEKGKKYTRAMTKKRYKCLFISSLQAIGHTTIQEEFCTKKTNSNNILYTKEVYSCKMSMPFCFEVDRVGQFTIKPDECGYVDFLPNELSTLGIQADKNGNILLSKDERFNRISHTLKAIQHLRTDVGNHLEDLNSKFTILADYSIGGGIFCNIFRENKLNLEYLKQTIDDNEEFRISKIYIGIRSGFMGELEQDLKDTFEGDERIIISTIGKTYDNYIEYLKNTLI